MFMFGEIKNKERNKEGWRKLSERGKIPLFGGGKGGGGGLGNQPNPSKSGWIGRGELNFNFFRLVFFNLTISYISVKYTISKLDTTMLFSTKTGLHYLCLKTYPII